MKRETGEKKVLFGYGGMLGEIKKPPNVMLGSRKNTG